MKRLLIVAVIIVMTTLPISGCGVKGDDGDAFISIQWLFSPFSYSDDNPSTPSSVQNGIYYQTSPGTYNFSYTSWDGSRWTGTYTITVNEGEDGFLFIEGDEGEDKHFDLLCYSIGPTLISTATIRDEEVFRANAAAVPKATNNEYSLTSDNLTRITPAAPEPLTFMSEKNQGKYTITLEYKKASE